MIDRILAVVRRMTRWELATLGALVFAPVVVGIALIAGVWLDEALIDVGVVLGYVVLIGVLGGIAVLRRLSIRRRLREVRGHSDPLLASAAEPVGEDAAVLKRAAQLPVSAICQFGARTGSTWARDVLAARASDGRFDFRGLADVVTAVNRGEVSPALVLGELQPHALAALVRMLATQALGPADDRADRELLAFVASAPVARRLAVDERTRIAERLILAGDRDRASTIVTSLPFGDARTRMLAADLLNPTLADPTAGDGRRRRVWLEAVNEIYRAAGLEPLVLVADGGTLFDRLSARPTDRRTGGPLISVVMSCFRPGEPLLTAIRSLVSQSWTDWELLVLDDASPAEYDGVLERAAEADPRIRVLRAAENGGTYVRRNDGLRAARGEFVTFQDSDDWAHPRRLEVQANALLAAPELAANLSASARVSEDLAFVTPRGTRLRPAETSLLFRREAVVGRIGYYDRVRKAADSEYRQRLEAVTGVITPMVEVGVPLTLVRYDMGSLSGSDFRDGWMHPARVAYRSAARSWHEDIAAGRADAMLAMAPTERPFPAPDSILGVPSDRRELDVVLVLDGRAGSNPSGRLDRVARELEQLVTTGRSVGVLHVDTLGTDTALGLFPRPLQDLVNRGLVARILPGDEVGAGAVVVRDAAVLLGLPAEPSGISTDRVLVLHDGTRPATAPPYPRRSVERLARTLFGSDAVGVDVGTDLDYDALLAPPEPPADAGAPILAELAARLRVGPAVPTGTSWAASPGTLKALVDAAVGLPSNGVVLELGSGMSTLWLALAADRERPDLRLVALEHDEGFAAQTVANLREYGVEAHADVRLAELRHLTIDGELYRWYDLDALAGVDQIDLLFVDGPPGGLRVRSRYPALPLLRDRLADGALVVVDDISRADESEMVVEWEAGLTETARLEDAGTVGRTRFLRYRTS